MNLTFDQRAALGSRPSALDSIYTCPMHPEIEQDHPGTCPKCGMALEPKTITAGPEDDTELRDMTKRFWFAAGLALPVLALAMLPMIGVPVHKWFSMAQLAFAYNLIGMPVAAWVLVPFFGMSTLLNPMLAAAGMSFSSVSVIANALRLRATRLE